MVDLLESPSPSAYTFPVAAKSATRRRKPVETVRRTSAISIGVFFTSIDLQWRVVRGSLRAGRLPNWPVFPTPAQPATRVVGKRSGRLQSKLGVLS